MKKFWKIAAVAALMVSAWTGPMIRGQAPTTPGPRKIFTNKTAFKLPLQVDEKERSRIKEVQLWVKEGASGTWGLKETVPATKKEFVFRTQQEGEYWFSVVTVDLSGRKNPPDVAREMPGLIVVVDRQPPEVEVHPVTAASGQQLLQCDVHDANPDPSKTKLEYQVDEEKWQALEAIQEQPAIYRVPENAIGKSIIRATAVDLAGNVTTHKISLQPAITTASTAAPAPVPPPVPAPAPAFGPVPPAVETQSNKLAGTPAPARAGSSRQIINSTRTQLNYQIDQQGPSGVGKVEVWMTRDEGLSWQRLCEDPNRHSPVAVELPGEGTYGLTLVVANGNGNGGTPPAPGEAPDFRVEVDVTKPVAQLQGVQAGTGADAGTFFITWSASDKNLKAEPIDLSYATSPAGPWLPIAKGLRNDGTFRWVAPTDLHGAILVRVEVADEAGNVTTCTTAQPVVLDRARPKAHILGLARGAIKQ